MDAFVTKHAHAIRGVLSCFDRVLCATTSATT
jgi:hypothetical protein